ncbi:2722_t:CDS:2 [Entrophospora sp. SA101]|nr:6931_t:CDS:2 [Entrophospora sp. SA101]CAJ0632460.1 4395_t:CDS:2 [Entrophospora sp. SA101]CAJ0757071.1 2722_t:CDS:2 [Entrophospora sp. SA101]CAJ0842905.1 5063_t:CDS:2 [Entrophospora sp. SA101]CAJ0915221.1 2337_t:CDS:2 [Entrophospora sp. SA101]
MFQQTLDEQQNYVQLQHHVQQNHDRQLQHHVEQNLNPNQQTLQQQIIDHGIIAFDNPLSVQNMTNDNKNKAAQSLPPPQQRQLVYVKSNSININNDINFNHLDLNLNVSSFNSRKNNEDPNKNEDQLFAAITDHMLFINDYRMKINQHHFELEQIINMLRRRDNNRDLNLNLNVFLFNSRNKNEDPLIAAITDHMLIIKDYRMKINQHHFEMEQIVNMLKCRDNNRDLNLNVTLFNSRDENEYPLITAITDHMLIIKDYRMKINQHHFELEQIVGILRRRDN